MNLENMSLEELSDHIRSALAALYYKLRESEGFGFEQHWSIMSVGESEYDWKLVAMDESSGNTGLSWPKVWWI